MENLLTVKQAARQLQLTEYTIREQLKTKRLRGVKKGRQWRIPQSALLESISTEKVPDSSFKESTAILRGLRSPEHILRFKSVLALLRTDLVTRGFVEEVIADEIDNLTKSLIEKN